MRSFAATFQAEMQGILFMSQRWEYLRAMSCTSLHKGRLERYRLKAHGEKAFVGDEQIILVHLVARIVYELHFGGSKVGDHLRQVPHAVRLGHLVQYVDPLACLWRILDSELDALRRVLNMDEGATLAEMTDWLGTPPRARCRYDGVTCCR